MSRPFSTGNVSVWMFLALLLPLMMILSSAAAEVQVVSSVRGTVAASWRTFGNSLRSARPHLVAAAVARFASISAL